MDKLLATLTKGSRLLVRTADGESHLVEVATMYESAGVLVINALPVAGPDDVPLLDFHGWDDGDER